MAAPARRRFSPLRLIGLLTGVVLLGAFAWSQGSSAYQRITAPAPATWFAPYVDVTLTPTFHFEDPVVSPPTTDVLGFVVADPRDRCAPTWGTYYDLDAAGRALDLDRRIVRLRERGGDAVISFGGASNQELAVACTDQAALTDAYRTVIERYSTTTVDFDVEGAALADDAANGRRAGAVATLQDEVRAAGRTLDVWLTLPVAPDGLTPEALATARGMLSAGVDLAGINVMTMNYGGSRAPGESMAAATERALRSTWAQLDAAYRAAGHPLTPDQVWARIGATPMIGRNDLEGEVFSLRDARALVAFANSVRLGRMSMWSANRDAGCGVQAGDAWVSNTCSGVGQEPLDFSWQLARLDATPPARTAVSDSSERAASASRDDPSSSPYPIWRTSKAYERADKVVWHGGVYEAKWFSLGDLPDASVDHLWDTPWRYVGPVLPSDASAAPARVAGELRRWSADQVYVKGDRVAIGGFAYKARWWTQGDRPQPDPDRPFDMPWTRLGRAAPDPQAAPSVYPEWQRRHTYPPGARVRYDGHAFEAKSWTRAIRPRPAPAAPESVPWRDLGSAVPAG